MANAHQRCQFVRVCHVSIFQLQVACFQAGKQCFDSPTAPIYGQHRCGPDAACRNNKHLPALKTHHGDLDGRECGLFRQLSRDASALAQQHLIIVREGEHLGLGNLDGLERVEQVFDEASRVAKGLLRKKH